MGGNNLSLKSPPVCDYIAKLTTQDFSQVSSRNFLRIEALLNNLNCETIDLQQLRSLCSEGIPNTCKGLRSIVWGLLLGIHSVHPRQWQQEMQTLHDRYTSDKTYILAPKLARSSAAKAIDALGTLHDDALSLTIKCINTDAVRTFVDPKDEKMEYHQRILKDTLTLYAVTYFDQNYTAGMTFIFQMIFVTIEEDMLPGYEQFVESESYFYYVSLMSEMKHLFWPRDTLPKGLKSILDEIEELSEIMARTNERVWNRLQVLGVELSMFAYRELLLLFCMDMNFTQTQTLWDVMFSHPTRLSFKKYIAAALIVAHDHDIVYGNFVSVLKALMKPNKQIDVEVLIKKAQHISVTDSAIRNEQNRSPS